MKPQIDASWYQLTPLCIACWQCNISLCNLLIENGADPNRKMYMSDFLLLRELKLNGPKLSARAREQVVKKSMEPISTDRSLHSPSLAYLGQHGETATVFPQSFIDTKYMFPFEQCLAKGDDTTARTVLAKTSKKSVCESCFSMLLYTSPFTMFQLARMGANVNMRDHSNAAGIHIACRTGNLERLAGMLLLGADIDCIGANQWYFLYLT